MNKKGYLEGRDMATTFNMLRANDLIWSFVVNNYLLGKEPFPFDLLYWNADSTRMPAAMHSFYLRNMYQENLLAQPGGITLGGVPIDLRKIKTPAYSAVDARGPHRAVEVDLSRRRRSTARAGALRAGGLRPYRRRGQPARAASTATGSTTKLPADPDEWLAGATEHRRLVVAGLGALGVAIRRQARCRRAQPGDGKLHADRGRAGQLREGAAELIAFSLRRTNWAVAMRLYQQSM